MQSIRTLCALRIYYSLSSFADIVKVIIFPLVEKEKSESQYHIYNISLFINIQNILNYLGENS